MLLLTLSDLQAQTTNQQANLHIFIKKENNAVLKTSPLGGQSFGMSNNIRVNSSH